MNVVLFVQLFSRLVCKTNKKKKDHVLLGYLSVSLRCLKNNVERTEKESLGVVYVYLSDKDLRIHITELI